MLHCMSWSKFDINLTYLSETFIIRWSIYDWKLFLQWNPTYRWFVLTIASTAYFKKVETLKNQSVSWGQNLFHWAESVSWERNLFHGGLLKCHILRYGFVSEFNTFSWRNTVPWGRTVFYGESNTVSREKIFFWKEQKYY